MQIKKIAVLGSGVMGSGIAAHCASAGLDVLLLDIVPEGAASRNQLTEGAKERMLKASPSPFAHPDCAKNLTCGNLEDDLGKLADVDWIIEAVLEKLEVKQAVYKKVDAARKKGSIVSSNTSTLPLQTLVSGFPASFAADFCIAHFFNPVRFMRLLEMLPSDTMDAARFKSLSAFGDEILGKEVVQCKDTPGFIANRIGIYFMTLALNEALALGLEVEQVDAALSKPYGIPKTGVFGLYDLIGLDLMPLIAKGMTDNIPSSDPFAKLDAKPQLLQRLIAEGYTGRKGKGGFYRIVKEGEKKIKQVVDLRTGEYRAENPVKEVSAEAAAFAQNIIAKTIAYAKSLLPQIAHSAQDIDLAMQAGYSWKRGLFPLETNNKKAAVGVKRSYLTFDTLKSGTPIMQSASARVWDAGDGVAVFEITTKMNAIDEGVFDALESALAEVKQSHKALIIAPDSDIFSAGANLKQMLAWAESGEINHVQSFIARGQSVMMSIKASPVPVVAALAGIALGGGCETLLHVHAIQAHIESSPGLVEVNVGLIPAWGGTKEMLLRHADRTRAYTQIITAATAGSALLARDLKILRPTDGISMNRARVLADAKKLALGLKPTIRPIQKVTSPNVTIDALLESVNAQGLPPHQAFIADILAQLMQFDTLDENAILKRELEAFVELIGTKPTQARIRHMLDIGKPLIN